MVVVMSAAVIFALIIALAIGLPILIGGGAISIKIISLLFFGKVGAFPVWALFIVFVLLFVVLRKARKRGIYP